MQEGKQVKVQYAKSGMVVMKQMTLKSPYLKGEVLWRSAINPYANKQTMSRSMSVEDKSVRQTDKPATHASTSKENLKLPSLFPNNKPYLSSSNNLQSNFKSKDPYSVNWIKKKASGGQSQAKTSNHHQQRSSSQEVYQERPSASYVVQYLEAVRHRTWK